MASGSSGQMIAWQVEPGTDKPERLILGWPKSLALGLRFSLLSAFNIGWRDLNVGNWIQRLQAHNTH